MIDCEQECEFFKECLKMYLDVNVPRDKVPEGCYNER